MKLSGNNLILLWGAAFLLTACSSHWHLQDANAFTENYYFNDSLKIRLAFFSDYAFSNENAWFRSRGKLKRLGAFSPVYRAYLFNATTHLEPFFISNAYLIRKRDSLFYARKGYQAVKKEKSYFFKKEHIRKGLKKIVLEYVVSLAEYDFYLIATADKRRNAATGVDFGTLARLAQDEYNQIMATSKAGAYYEKYTPANPFQIASEAFSSAKEGNYLLPLVRLKPIQKDYLYDQNQQDLFLQCYSTFAALAGDYTLLDEIARERQGNSPARAISEEALRLEPADERIMERAASERVVMFNESHVNPRHRQYVARLLERFYHQGFRYLALEALNESDSLLHARGFPEITTGFYVKEHNMANLIRLALKTGFRLVDYEYTADEGKNGKGREYNQASRLYQKTLAKDPSAKVLVLAGHDHISEITRGDIRRMAEYFTEISGVNPLTINQTSYQYLPVNEALNGNVWVPYVKGGQPYRPDVAKSDLYLVNKLQPAENRVCLEADPNAYNQVEVQLPRHVFAAGAEYVLMLYLAAELNGSRESLPCFVQKVQSDHPLTLQIPPGNYIVMVKDADANVVYREPLVVAPKQ